MSRVFGRIAVYVLIFMSTGAISGIYTGHQALRVGTTAAASNTPLQLMYGSIYLFLVVLLVTKRRGVLSLLFSEKWMTTLILLAIASTLWSVAPGETFRRSLGLLGTTLAGLYIGTHFEPRQQLRILAVCVGAAAVLSLVAGLAFPEIGRSSDGLWQGVFFQKNTLGRMMCLGVLSFSFLAVGQRRYRLFSIVMIPLCGALLLLSGSVTALLVTVALLALLPFTLILHWPVRRLAWVGLPIAAVVVPVGIWALNNIEFILGALGKSSSLTGRLPLWRLVRAQIETSPYFGLGYTAFWSTAEADRFRQALNWDVMNAHNGFLEMMLGLGVVGLAVFLIGILRNFILAFRTARAGGQIDQAWPLFLLAFCMLWDVTDSTLFAGNSVVWLLYTANAFWLVDANARVGAEEQEEYAPLDQLTALRHT